MGGRQGHGNSGSVRRMGILSPSKLDERRKMQILGVGRCRVTGWRGWIASSMVGPSFPRPSSSETKPLLTVLQQDMLIPQPTPKRHPISPTSPTSPTSARPGTLMPIPQTPWPTTPSSSPPSTPNARSSNSCPPAPVHQTSNGHPGSIRPPSSSP